MNASNDTEPYYNYTERTNDLVTFNFTLTLTESVTLTPVTFDSADVLGNLKSLSPLTTTQTQGNKQCGVIRNRGRQFPVAKTREFSGSGRVQTYSCC